MKMDNGYFYNMEPVIDLEHFVELFLVSLANYNKLVNDKRKKYMAVLPLNYKDSIEKAMFSADALFFLQLINHYDYYENQSKWEYMLSEEINKYLIKNNKKINYNFLYDYIEIVFSVDEMIQILEKYDSSIKNTMKNFICYIDILGIKRYNKLTEKEAKRNIEREYIKINKINHVNTWEYDSDNKDSKIDIYINPNYIDDGNILDDIGKKESKCINTKIKLKKKIRK